MIDITVAGDEGIIVIEPTGKLQKSDFEKLSAAVDGYSGGERKLKGLLIHTKLFPGWDDFNAFLEHVKFVKGHHKSVQRIAVVTDSKLGSIGPGIARHFVSAQIKHFDYDNLPDAKAWLTEAV